MSCTGKNEIQENEWIDDNNNNNNKKTLKTNKYV